MKTQSGQVIWLTGLSGSGKSTLSEALIQILKSQGLLCESLDGDNIRKQFPNTGFSRSERDQHIRRVAQMASELEKDGKCVVVSLISPFEESRKAAQNLCVNFKLIYLSTPLEVCEQRDVKGLYKKARLGQIQQFTGIDDPYEVPKKADLILDTSKKTVENCVQEILQALK